ncbi:MAG: PQQ-dependent sugar dehydrogenase [Spirochaetaceae bacterium]|nr:PQQ-dependent sugar dehydrogenase [Spirochaetaceae bacterium]
MKSRMPRMRGGTSRWSAAPVAGVLVLTLLLGCAPTVPAQTETYQSREHGYAVEAVVTRLAHPWAVAFLPDGGLLITERPGRLLRIDADGARTTVTGLPEVAAAGQGGLLDVILDPGFAANRLIYFSFTERAVGGLRTAVARARLEGDRLLEVRRIFAMNRASRGGRHFGSRLAILDDGDLVVGLGDRGQRERAQDPADHAGSVVRIRPDGSPSPRTAATAIAGAAPEVFTWGHRNIQGLAIHPETGAVWVHEHGPRGGDEINILRGGANYGWPVVTFGREYAGPSIGIGTEAPGMEPPLLHWTPSIAPSGMAFYTGDEFPHWRGDLFVGALVGRHLRRVVLRGEEAVAQEVLLDRLAERVRDVRQGPDGALWVLTDESDGALYRISNPER